MSHQQLFRYEQNQISKSEPLLSLLADINKTGRKKKRSK